jgi:hypothetical protein
MGESSDRKKVLNSRWTEELNMYEYFMPNNFFFCKSLLCTEFKHKNFRNLKKILYKLMKKQVYCKIIGCRTNIMKRILFVVL